MRGVNLKDKLIKIRQKELSGTAILSWVETVLKDVEEQRKQTLQNLQTSESDLKNTFNIDFVDANAVFHINHIKKICIDYRLRFLDTKYFKGEYPPEVISKIHQLEKEHNTTLGGFKIVAPSVLFKLKKADDPILFAPMGNDYYYMIHKWGNDLHPLRKFKYLPVKNVGNLLICMLIICALLTQLSYGIFSEDKILASYWIVLFLFYTKGFVGFVLYYGFAVGKNFSEYSWQSKYDKVT